MGTQPATTPRRTTARRIVMAFAVVLGLFALALAVMIVALDRIGDAEREVARLDHAKHAGHHAAAMAREQYIHQAHTLLEWNASHMSHYDEVAVAARGATVHLRAVVPAGDPRAAEIATLIAESDRTFRDVVLPAVERNERDRARELHDLTVAPVERVVALNDDLNRTLEASSAAAQRRAADIRSRARLAVLGCFALAILAALGVGLYLMRSISRPVAALRAGAERIGRGDLTARIAMPGDDELAELGAVFDRMAEDLAARQTELLEASRLASIGQVASGVAHEINNPLGVMLGYLRLLRREAALADREELHIIEDEARQCQAIVAGLLDLARPVQLQVGAVELGEVISEAVSRLDDSGQSDGVRVTVSGGPAAPLSADEAKLRQIALNLLGNAIEAARDPAASEPTVDVSWAVDGDEVSLHIDDRGPGIPASVRARVFEPFVTTRPRGHGLGLAIARSLARAHGGDITLAPRAGGGTSARLTVPARTPETAS
ncbi:MAG: HAMP domain-containing sensor histidine kinase [Kofleriaceae bacterium]